MNAVVTDSMHDRVLNHISYEYSQSGQGGGRSTNTKGSQQNHSGGGGASLHDEPVAYDDSSSKTQSATRSESSLPKADLIPGSYGTTNSSVMKANFFRTLEEHVHLTCSSLPISG